MFRYPLLVTFIILIRLLRLSAGPALLAGCHDPMGGQPVICGSLYLSVTLLQGHSPTWNCSSTPLVEQPAIP